MEFFKARSALAICPGYQFINGVNWLTFDNAPLVARRRNFGVGVSADGPSSDGGFRDGRDVGFRLDSGVWCTARWIFTGFRSSVLGQKDELTTGLRGIGVKGVINAGR